MHYCVNVVNIALCYFVHKSRRVGHTATFVALKSGGTVPPTLKNWGYACPSSPAIITPMLAD